MVAGRKYEMLVKCPACDRRIRIRSGLSGKVQCPLPGCRAIYERQTTSAAVSVVGLASNLDHLLRGRVISVKSQVPSYKLQVVSCN